MQAPVFTPYFLSLVNRAAAGLADHAFAGAATGERAQGRTTPPLTS